MSSGRPPVPTGSLPFEPSEIGVIIVDHGSLRRESNDLLLQVVSNYAATSPYAIVEPAHMELAQPTVDSAFDQCVRRGAKLVIVHPYFLLPGRHWDSDIPRLASEASSRHESVRYLVTAPLGLHPLLAEVIQSRIVQCISHATGNTESCDLCQGTDKCQLR